jgi:hypothetical protein
MLLLLEVCASRQLALNQILARELDSPTGARAATAEISTTPETTKAAAAESSARIASASTEATAAPAAGSRPSTAVH